MDATNIAYKIQGEKSKKKEVKKELKKWTRNRSKDGLSVRSEKLQQITKQTATKMTRTRKLKTVFFFFGPPFAGYIAQCKTKTSRNYRSAEPDWDGPLSCLNSFLSSACSSLDIEANAPILLTLVASMGPDPADEVICRADSMADSCDGDNCDREPARSSE